MTYEEYKKDLFAEINQQIDENQKKLIVLAEGTAHEEIAAELVDSPMCSRSLSLWYLYEQQCRYELADQVKGICEYFEKVRLIDHIEKLENVTIWAANLEKSAGKLENSGIPYLPVGDMAVYFKFYDIVYEADNKGQDMWPYDYIRPVRKKHLKQWGLTVQELLDSAKNFDINERLQTVLDTRNNVVNRTLGDVAALLPDTDGFCGLYGENGIGMMFYPDGLSDIAQHFRSDLYLMPFSNDLILVCSKSEHALGDLQEVVKKKQEENKKYGLEPLHVSGMVYQFENRNLTIKPAVQTETIAKHTVR